MQIDNRAFYTRLRKLATPISFQSLMLAAVAAADALMLGGVHPRLPVLGEGRPRNGPERFPYHASLVRRDLPGLLLRV